MGISIEASDCVYVVSRLGKTPPKDKGRLKGWALLLPIPTLVGQVQRRGVGNDATSWATTQTGRIWLCGLGRPDRHEVKNVFFDTYYCLSNLTQFTSNVLTAAKAEANGIALHKKCNALDAL